MFTMKFIRNALLTALAAGVGVEALKNNGLKDFRKMKEWTESAKNFLNEVQDIYQEAEQQFPKGKTYKNDEAIKFLKDASLFTTATQNRLQKKMAAVAELELTDKEINNAANYMQKTLEPVTKIAEEHFAKESYKPKSYTGTQQEQLNQQIADHIAAQKDYLTVLQNVKKATQKKDIELGFKLLLEASHAAERFNKTALPTRQQSQEIRDLQEKIDPLVTWLRGLFPESPTNTRAHRPR